MSSSGNSDYNAAALWANNSAQKTPNNGNYVNIFRFIAVIILIGLAAWWWWTNNKYRRTLPKENSPMNDLKLGAKKTGQFLVDSNGQIHVE